MALMSKKAAGGRPKVPGGAADADASAVEVAIAHEPGAPYPSVAELGADVSASSRPAYPERIFTTEMLYWHTLKEFLRIFT